MGPRGKQLFIPLRPDFLHTHVQGFADMYVTRGDYLGGSDGKASAYNVGDLGSIHRSGRSPGEGNGN